MVQRMWWAVVVLAFLALLVGCSSTTASPALLPGRPPVVSGTVVEPPLVPPAQVLLDTSGRRFSVAVSSRQRLTVVFFGYTHCPDLCPTTVADLAAARRLLPPGLRDRVVVVFVTEDPERDAPRDLRRWLDGFDPALVGLIGGNAGSEAMLKSLYAPATGRNPTPSQQVQHGRSDDDHGPYGLDHAGVVYAFSPQGASVIYTGGTTPAQYAADFSALLQP